MFKFTDLIICDLTESCNIDCKYCLMLNKHRHKGTFISFDLFKKIVNKAIHHRILQRREKIPLTFVFHGGEPFSVGKEHFYKLAEYAYTAFTNAGISFQFGTQTNGTYLDDEYLKILRKFEFSVGLSLDDLGPGNDLRIENSEEFFQEKIDLLLKNHFHVGIISVATSHNIKSLPEFMKKIHNLPGRGGQLTILPFENPDPENMSYEADIDDLFTVFRAAIDGFIERTGSDAKLIKTLIPMTFIDLVTDHQRVFRSGCGGKICGTAIGMISIRPDGWFGNCDRFPEETEFNNVIRLEDFDFLSNVQLKRAVYLADIKHKLMKKKGCDTCRADYICPHGCMVFDYHRTEGFNIKDEVCHVHQRFYDYISDNLIPFAHRLADNKIPIPCDEEIYSIKPDVASILERNGIEVKITSTIHGDYNNSLLFQRA